LRQQGKNLYVITTNDKTVKLWKVSEKNIKKILKPSGKEMAMPKLQTIESGLIPR
jgi:serine/threonine-protein phosphatase 2A regulatory subunit B